MSSNDEPKFPKTLQEAIEFFADKQNAFEFAVSLRWPDGIFCPFCSVADYSFISTRQLWKCKGCKKQYSVRVGTIFEDSPIALSKWLMAIWMLVNCKNGVSSYDLHRAIGVTQKTAWFMLHRIRAAIKAKSFDRKLAGIVEADETYIGGALKNMHAWRRAELENVTRGERIERRKDRHQERGRPLATGPGPAMGKTLVQAVLERDGEVRAQILQSFGTLERIDFMRENIEEGSQVMTDTGNASLGPKFLHRFINHQEQYVDGIVLTNSVENFCALLQRGLSGTYVSVEPYHLSAYVDEQCFRFNTRKQTDGTRFALALRQTAGRRLTYAKLTRTDAK